MGRDEIYREIVSLVAEIGEVPQSSLSEESVLMGQDPVIRSRMLVELFLALAEFAENRLGAEFQWASAAAKPVDKSPLRTIGSLTFHLAQLGGVP